MTERLIDPTADSTISDESIVERKLQLAAVISLTTPWKEILGLCAQYGIDPADLANAATGDDWSKPLSIPIWVPTKE